MRDIAEIIMEKSNGDNINLETSLKELEKLEKRKRVLVDSLNENLKDGYIFKKSFSNHWKKLPKNMGGILEILNNK